jgi:hypothetical protein
MTSLQSVQVDPLPMSSGGQRSQTQKELEKTNETLTMLSAQSTADAMYDPPVPSPVTSPSIREAFCGADPHYLSEYLLIASFGLIVYGLLAK